ncbi:hypothetical protein B296_00026896 [Ensete ventricosum]|uniref:Uncharacterized protein n=1 Tax=Ensete ventricosum TaxID=4639 RepID=A0A427AEJ5_ENSVE|nr:hypothetical protein B296_00026896 [Ensete ventricosum]
MNLKKGADDSAEAKFDIRSDYHEVHLYYLDFVFDCSVYAGQYVTFPAPVVVAHLVDGQMSIGCHAGGRADRHAKDLGTIVNVPRRNASHMCAMIGVIDGRVWSIMKSSCPNNLIVAGDLAKRSASTLKLCRGGGIPSSLNE